MAFLANQITWPMWRIRRSTKGKHQSLETIQTRDTSTENALSTVKPESIEGGLLDEAEGERRPDS